MRGIVNFPAKPHQRAVLNDPHRHRCVVMHRRAGKTCMAIFACLAELMGCKRPMPRVGYLAPYLKQAKQLAWDYLTHTVGQAPQYFQINRGELSITFLPNMGKLTLWGADNYQAIRGQYFDFICIDEMADIDPGLWDSVIVYTLADRQGRALVMGTPRGRMNKLYEFSQFADSDPDWSYHCYPVDQTNMIVPAELARLERAVTSGHLNKAIFEQEMHCSFNAALQGAVYGDEMDRLQAEGRFTTVEFDASLPVMTAWDLGYADATAVLHIQRRGNQLHVIGYDEFTLTKLPDIIASLKGKPWAVNYSAHYGPHDLMVTEYGSGNSRWQIAAGLGFEFEPPVNWSIEDGIESVRTLLSNLWISTRNGGDRLLEVLINYRYDYDDDRKCYKRKPLHDWTSHGADATRMFAVAHDPTRFLREEAASSRRGRRGKEQLQWIF